MEENYSVKHMWVIDYAKMETRAIYGCIWCLADAK